MVKVDTNLMFRVDTYLSTTNLASINAAQSAYMAMKIDGTTLQLNSQTVGNVLIGTVTSNASMGQTGILQVSGGVRATSGLLTVYELGTIAQNTTITQDLPYNGLYLLTNGGNNSALIMVTRAGGSRGVQLVSSTNSNADIVVGTTSEPAGGNYLRVWMSAVGTMSIKNVNAYTGPYSMTPITTQ